MSICQLVMYTYSYPYTKCLLCMLFRNPELSCCHETVKISTWLIKSIIISDLIRYGKILLKPQAMTGHLKLCRIDYRWEGVG